MPIMSVHLPPAPVLTCDGAAYKRLASAAVAWLEQHYEAVNQLNVFPVPDGDTGTNMLLTMRAAYGEIADNPSPDVGDRGQAGLRRNHGFTGKFRHDPLAI